MYQWESKSNYKYECYFPYSYGVLHSRLEILDFNGLWCVRIVFVPPDFLQLAILGSLEADFPQQSYSKHVHLMHCVICVSFEPFSDS